jgi:hypothetical protein
MEGILYKGDGHTIEVLSDTHNYGYYMPSGFSFQTKNKTCIVFAVDSFGFDFEKIANEDKLSSVINLYVEKYGDIDNVLFILNETIVNDETNFVKFSKKIGKDCFYANFDMMAIGKKYQLFLGNNNYWREIHNTTFTWCINKKYLNSIKPLFEQMFSEIRFKTFDTFLSNKVWSTNALVVSPLPSLSVHLDSHISLPPCINWTNVWNKNVAM